MTPSKQLKTAQWDSWALWQATSTLFWAHYGCSDYQSSFTQAAWWSAPCPATLTTCAPSTSPTTTPSSSRAPPTRRSWSGRWTNPPQKQRFPPTQICGLPSNKRALADQTWQSCSSEANFRKLTTPYYFCIRVLLRANFILPNFTHRRTRRGRTTTADSPKRNRTQASSGIK